MRIFLNLLEGIARQHQQTKYNFKKTLKRLLFLLQQAHEALL
jgi:hypothetical protein